MHQWDSTGDARLSKLVRVESKFSADAVGTVLKHLQEDYRVGHHGPLRHVEDELLDCPL